MNLQDARGLFKSLLGGIGVAFLLNMLCWICGTQILQQSTAHAYVFMRSQQSGAKVQWSKNANLIFKANERNLSGLGSSSLFELFTKSLNRLKQASFNGFSFTYYQGQDPSVFPNSTVGGGDNLIYFTSHAPASERLPCGTLAVTSVWFQPSNGQISKVDLRFNDLCYQFTTNPQDTQNGGSKVFIQDVITHEMGHALGLDHSQNSLSSMLFTAAKEMSKPSCDDKAALMQLYAPSSIQSQIGTLTGNVLTPSGTPIFGAHVQAIHLERGQVLASALTDRDGSFSIGGLLSGNYTVLIEPYYPGSGTLGAYYSSLFTQVCNGYQFERTFVKETPYLVKTFLVNPQASTNIGPVTVQCTPPQALPGSPESTLQSAPVLPFNSPTIAVQSVMNLNWSGSAHHYYRINQQSGALKISALSFSLGSPVDLEVEVLNSAGNLISQQKNPNTFNSQTSGFTQYDADTRVNLTSTQNIFIHVASKGNISFTAFPMGNIGVSSQPYYLLSISKEAPNNNTLFSEHPLCDEGDNFEPYPNQGTPGTPTDSRTPGSDNNPSQNENQPTGCGTIRKDSSGNFNSIAFLNFLTLFSMLLVSHKMIRKKFPA